MPMPAHIVSALGCFGRKPEEFERVGSTWTPRGIFFHPTFPGRTIWKPERNKLYVFGFHAVMVIRGGAQPAAWWKSSMYSAWRAIRPPRFPPVPAWQVREREPWRAFIRSTGLPPTAMDLIAKAHPDVRWGLLQVMTRLGTAGIQLALDHPAAAALAYYHFRFHPHRGHCFERTRRLVAGRRRSILEACGFPPSALQVMKRVPPHECSFANLVALRQTLVDKALLKRLAHLGPGVAVGTRVCQLLPYAGLVSADLLREAVARHRTPRLDRCLADIACLRKSLALHDRAEPYRTVRELVLDHRKLVRRFNEARMADYFARMQFPPPPLPDSVIGVPGGGTVRICALSSWRALEEHAHAARNCALSYASRIRAGEAYLYAARMEGEGDALHTALVVPSRRDWCWELHQISADGNGPAAREVHEGFLRFLALHQKHGRGSYRNLCGSGARRTDAEAERRQEAMWLDYEALDLEDGLRSGLYRSDDEGFEHMTGADPLTHHGRMLRVLSSVLIVCEFRPTGGCACRRIGGICL